MLKVLYIIMCKAYTWVSLIMAFIPCVLNRAKSCFFFSLCCKLNLSLDQDLLETPTEPDPRAKKEKGTQKNLHF